MGTHHQQQWLEYEEEPAESGWNDPQQRLQHQVEIQSRQIENVLSRHQVQAGVSGGSIRSHWVSFDLVAQLSDGWDRLRRLTGELTSALGVPEVRLDRQGGRLRLAVRRYEPHPVDLLDLLDLLPEVGGLSLALGLDHQGCPVMLNLSQVDLHNVLMTGIPGAGKSSIMRSIAVAVALTCRQSQAQLAVIGVGSAPSGITTHPDPLAPVNYLPHMLFPMAATPDEAVEALAYLVEEAAYRADCGISTPALVVLIDDADMLLRRTGKVAGEHLAALLHAPAESGIRVIVGAANPELPDLRALLQHNVDLRIVGRVADERAALAATGREGTYAQYLEGKGDFLAVSAAGVVPFQAAYIDDYDLHLTLTELHRASDPVLLAQRLNKGPKLEPSWSTSEAQSFTYDGVSQRASFEQDDRSARVTVDGEFTSGRSEQEDDLSWLNGAGRPTVTLVDGWHPSVPELQQEAPEDDVWSFDDAPPEAGTYPAAEPVEFQAMRPVGPRYFGPMYPAEETPAADDEEDDVISAGAELPDYEVSEASSEVELTDEGLADDNRGDYRMLPFDQMSEPEAVTDDDASGISEANSLDAGQAPSAQVLWPVEPTYMDFDDDMWDAGDVDEDDWRKRLH